MYVLNWNDGLVAFPGVTEFDAPGQSVDLRAQVYGATVSTYSWDTSQATNVCNATGASTYKLKFLWKSVIGQTDFTNTITVTATMTDTTTKTETLTFNVSGGTYNCPSGGGSGTSATWPAVLPPDKPAEQQDLLTTDSATRPYAVSQASGTLFAAHTLPASTARAHPGGPMPAAHWPAYLTAGSFLQSGGHISLVGHLVPRLPAAGSF